MKKLAWLLTAAVCFTSVDAHAVATLLPNGMQCFSATTPQSGGQYGPVATLGAITGGGGYRDGVYANVPLTGGSGRGALATVTVMMGAVTGVTITNPGTHFTGADTLSAAATSIGGRGSGFSVPVATVTSTGTGMVGLLGPVSPGFGGRAGTYGGVALTGGAGAGATANINVQGGRVANVTILNPGASYQVGDILSAPAAAIGNVTGFSVPVASVSINQSLAGGSVYMFVPNTTTVKQTWQDAAQTILNQNPTTLDANGCATLYGTGIYRQVLTDALGNIVWDRPTTDTSQQNVSWAGVALATSTPNLAILDDPGFNAVDGSIVSFIPVRTNTGAFAVSFQGTSYTNIPVVLDMFSGPQPLMGNEIAPMNVVVAIYAASENTFHLLNSAQAANLDLLVKQVQEIAMAFAQQPTVQSFAGGTGNYTPTAPTSGVTVAYIRVRMVAGGGGGGSQTSGGSAGSASSLGGWSVNAGVGGNAPNGNSGGAGGLGGTGGTNGTGTLIGRWTGGAGSSGSSTDVASTVAIDFAGGQGGASIFGGNGGGVVGGPAQSGSGGGGGGGAQGANNMGGPGGGGAGEGVEFIVIAPQTLSYAVGAAGTGGSGGGANGGAGEIIIEEFYH